MALRGQTYYTQRYIKLMCIVKYFSSTTTTVPPQVSLIVICIIKLKTKHIKALITCKFKRNLIGNAEKIY